MSLHCLFSSLCSSLASSSLSKSHEDLRGHTLMQGNGQGLGGHRNAQIHPYMYVHVYIHNAHTHRYEHAHMK